MKAVMRNGTIKEIDTSFIFNNQYNTIDGERIYDTNIKQIIDDIRLGEFYCCSKKQGTYNEVAKAIADERSEIDHCKGCFWYQVDHRVDEMCYKVRKEEDDTVTIDEKTVYELGCIYKKKYSEKCVHDIDETPRLFREMQDCFFCNHPEGVPDMTDFCKFLVDNASKYDIVSRYNNELKYAKKFGSYQFEKPFQSNYFILSNARNSFRFLIDFANKTFILSNTIGYKEVERFEVSDWKDGKCVSVPIKNWDKFTEWLFPIIDDYNASI